MNERPLSPHLQIYRLPPTALLSIAHRITGVALSLGLILWVVYLSACADPESFELAQSWLRSGFGRLFLVLWVFAVFLHFCHGVRHLIWDTGRGFAKEALNRHAWIVLATAVALTGLSFSLLA